MEIKDISSKTEIPSGSEKKLKTKFLWTIVFLAIAALTVFAIVSQKDFSIKNFTKFMSSLNPWWVLAAVLSMLSFIVFEALALMTIIKSFGIKTRFYDGISYSAGDIYFSAITPSSTGGQPASAYFMMKDGISGSATAVALIVNLIMYSFSIIVIGVISVIVEPWVFFGLPAACKVLVVFGSACLVLLAVFFILIIFKSEFLHKLGDGVLNLLAKIHLIRHLDKKKQKFSSMIRSYSENANKLKGQRKTLTKVFIFNLLQRASLIFVAMFVFLASDGDVSLCDDVWVCQCMTVLGTNVLPIPGAMGVSDYMLIAAFGSLGISESAALNLNLVSRGISFYICVITCGILMISKVISYNLPARKNKNDTKNEEVEK